MMGITSNSQSGVGLNESSALSHVYIPYPPLRCSVTGSRGLFYDDGTKFLLSPTSDQVFKWNTGLPNVQDSTTPDLIDEGPVLSIKYSLDGKVIGIQRSDHEIQFRDIETGQTFSQRCKPESESILGFFWTDCPNYDVIFVKTSGLDMFSYEHELKTLRLVGTKKSNVSWYVYTHESRMVLLASGMQCKAFTGFQFSSGGIIKLPLFDMSMAKAEDNQKPVLAKEDVHIVTIYGRIYCLQVDRVAMLLNMYRFYRDAVIKQSSVPIYSSKIAVSVIDNVLLVHQVDAKVVILYDVFSDTRTPISAPLPLLFRGLPKNNTSVQTAHRESGNLNDDDEAVIYGNSWTFLVPNLICDVAHSNLWRIHIDLEAIAASSSDAPFVLEFLQRRKLEPIKAKNLCLGIIRTLILERRPVPMVSKAIDVLVSTYSHSIKMGVPLRKNTVREEGDSTSVTNPEEMEDAPGEDSTNPEELSSSLQLSQESEVISAAVSPDELYSLVFSPIEEEMAVEPAYMVSVIIEFFRSVGAEKLKVHPNLYVMTIQLLARSERYAELGIFVVHKILEPSKEVALQLLESGRQNLETRKLGMDMLRQLSLHHDYVMLLVQDGYYLEALRYARRNQVNSIGPGLFLESAIAKNDSQHVAAILRFFSDFIPGFKDTSEYSRYCRTLSEMNSASSSSITA